MKDDNEWIHWTIQLELSDDESTWSTVATYNYDAEELDDYGMLIDWVATLQADRHANAIPSNYGQLHVWRGFNADTCEAPEETRRWRKNGDRYY